MYEHRTDHLLPKPAYRRRVARQGFLGLALALIALAVGVVGYHLFEGLDWLDALVNASMILGGMGPVNELHTVGGKIFASAYALFSGAGFLVIVALVMAPVFHRFLHRFHLEAGPSPSAGKEQTISKK
jgi:hypothetical protein